MENNAYYSYPDSGNSSPRSREIEFDNNPPPPQTWVDDQAQPPSYKVKLMISYGGKILPRPHDNQLAYLGGDTKIISVDRGIKFSVLFTKLASLCDPNSPADVCFKYQLPGEDLDALISVTNEEDLEHMMSEYDRLNRNSAKQPARLRIFLFLANNYQKIVNSDEFIDGLEKGKSDQGQWFVDVLNTVHRQPTTFDVTSPPPPLQSESPVNPDFLFGFDKNANLKASDLDSNPDLQSADQKKEVAVSEPVAAEAAVQKKMEKFQISETEVQKPNDENDNSKVHQTDHSPVYQTDHHQFYTVQEKAPPAHIVPSSAPVSMSIPASYWPERHVTVSNYPVGGPHADQQPQQPVYIIQHPPVPNVYHPNSPMKHVTGPAGGQSFYSIPQRVLPADVYREQQPVYTASMIQHQQSGKVAGGYTAEGMGSAPAGMIRQSMAAGTLVTDQGYAHVSYDNAGMPIYYTMTGSLAPPYQVVNIGGAPVVDVRAAAGGGLGQDSGIAAAKATQNTASISS